MPCFDCELGILAIGNRLPSGLKYFLQHVWDEVFVNRLGWNAIDAGAKSLIGNEMIGGMRDIHADGLRTHRARQKSEPGKNNEPVFQKSPRLSEF